MRTLISSLAVAFAFAVPAYAGDVTTDDTKSTATHGRQIEDSEKSVKALGSDTSTQGRKIEGERAVKTKKDKATTKRLGRTLEADKKKRKAAVVEQKQGRAIEGEVKSGDKDTTAQGRAIEGEVKSGDKDTSVQGRAIEEKVKSGDKDTSAQGRAVGDEKK